MLSCFFHHPSLTLEKSIMLVRTNYHVQDETRVQITDSAQWKRVLSESGRSVLVTHCLWTGDKHFNQTAKMSQVAAKSWSVTALWWLKWASHLCLMWGSWSQSSSRTCCLRHRFRIYSNSLWHVFVSTHTGLLRTAYEDYVDSLIERAEGLFSQRDLTDG